MPSDGTPDMNRRNVLKIAGSAVAAAGFSGVASATPGREPGPKEGEILVGVCASEGTPEEVVERYVPGKAEVVHSHDGLRYVAVKFPGNDRARENFKEALTKKRGIKYAEDNTTHEPLFEPNDPRNGDQYATEMVNAEAAWDTTTGSSDVTVAVIDTGADYTHPDLEGNFRSDPGKDFVDDDGDPYPPKPGEEYHGTHVSGIAGGVIDNGTGISGMGNHTLINGRGLSPNGGSTSDIADAIYWATDQGADVINMSLGGGGYTETMKNAVSYAQSNGALVVCAAGNAGKNSVDYPAAYSECIAVSALDSDGTLASYSNYGDQIELAAPGTSVLSSIPTEISGVGNYYDLDGTSMASPVVAGVAGLTKAQWGLGNTELRTHLKSTAVDVGLSSAKQGSGRVDAQNAVETDPSGGGGGGGDGGDGGGGGGGDGGTKSTSASVSSSLSGYWDYDDYSYPWQFSSTSTVEVILEGPDDADFDLYLSTAETDAAGPEDYDYASTSPDAVEGVVIDNPDTSTDLQIDVDSYRGDGSYTLTVTEYSG